MAGHVPQAGQIWDHTSQNGHTVQHAQMAHHADWVYPNGSHSHSGSTPVGQNHTVRSGNSMNGFLPSEQRNDHMTASAPTWGGPNPNCHTFQDDRQVNHHESARGATTAGQPQERAVSMESYFPNQQPTDATLIGSPTDDNLTRQAQQPAQSVMAPSAEN